MAGPANLHFRLRTMTDIFFSFAHQLFCIRQPVKMLNKSRGID
jgi:hypothetical protein